MIELYTWATPNGRKVSIALEELGVAYRAIAVDIGKGEQTRPEFLRISPNGRIPAVVDADTGRTLMESGAILLWLAQRHGALMPAGDRYWTAVEWLMWQMGGVGPMLGQCHHFLKFNPGKSAYAEQRYAAEALRLYGVLDRRLADHEYVADTWSMADIAIWPWIARFEWQQVDLGAFPNVRRWYQQIAERPAVRRGYDVPFATTPIPLP